MKRSYNEKLSELWVNHKDRSVCANCDSYIELIGSDGFCYLGVLIKLLFW